MILVNLSILRFRQLKLCKIAKLIMKYSIIICPKTEKSIAQKQAFRFIQAILRDMEVQHMHRVDVFFYGLAVKSAFYDLQDWQTLAKKGVKLTACSTIAESYQPKEAHPHFSIAGIGQWMESTIDADKNIEFI